MTALPEKVHGSRTAGYTLMEIVVAIIALAAVMYFLSGMLANTGKVYEFILKRQNAGQSASQAQDSFFQEVKLADSLLVANASTITVRRQTDTETFIRYSIDGTALKRAEAASAVALGSATDIVYISNLSSGEASFAYFDENNSVLNSLPLNEADRNSVRFILITLKIDEDGQVMNTRRRIFLENYRW